LRENSGIVLGTRRWPYTLNIFPFDLLQE